MLPSPLATSGDEVATPDRRTRSEIIQRPSRRRLFDPTPWLVAAAALVIRLVTAAKGPTDFDSAQYASAVNHFDVTHGQPQPPGYWLYVETGRLVKSISGLGAVHSLVVVAAIASAAAAGLAAVAGRDLGGRWTGIAAGLVVASSPFAWFSGSIVSTYSFDAVACSLLIIMAWRARPGSWHGVGAIVALGLLAGFRPSIVQAFAILAILAVVGSTRRWGRLVITVVAGAASVAVWMIPMGLQQPGGIGTWIRATRIEATGAAQATSILDHAPGGHLNLGTFAAYTVVALAPLAAVAVLAGVALAIRGLVRRRRSEQGSPAADPASATAPTWSRPWYQTKAAILTAAILPPVAIVALIQFAKGGYLLAYLPAAVIALLLPLSALNQRVRRRGSAPGSSPVWLVLTSLAVAGLVALGAQRFLEGNGVLPQSWLKATTGGLWLQQARYQAPYADTRAAVTGADAIDTALGGIAPSANPARDVVVFDTVDGGANIYRNAGYALPDLRIALIQPNGVLYNQLHGALYYASGTSVATAPSGSVILVASPSLPGLASLVAQGYALPVATPRPIGGYRVWQLLPGTTILGVHLISRSGPRSLGTGI
ncbi:MAG TPA: hypothetical protein VG014_13655 [Acidimicrobiales bacterium]|nr:hypothetical protein [Acidimicrobiales bacterium]